MMSPPAICWRFERGRIGERYILGGEDMTLREILADDRALRWAAAPPRVRLPARALLPVAYVAESVARLTGRQHPHDRRGRAHGRASACSSRATRRQRELGYAWRVPIRRSRRRLPGRCAVAAAREGLL